MGGTDNILLSPLGTDVHLGPPSEGTRKIVYSLPPQGRRMFSRLPPWWRGRRENSQTVGVQWVPDIFCVSPPGGKKSFHSPSPGGHLNVFPSWSPGGEYSLLPTSPLGEKDVFTSSSPTREEDVKTPKP